MRVQSETCFWLQKRCYYVSNVHVHRNSLCIIVRTNNLSLSVYRHVDVTLMVAVAPKDYISAIVTVQLRISRRLSPNLLVSMNQLHIQVLKEHQKYQFLRAKSDA